MSQPRDQIIRQARESELSPQVIGISHRRVPRKLFSPVGLLLNGFILLSILGGFILCFPFASNTGTFTSLDTSFFTAISAVTVTGHTVVSTSTYWSPFGQLIIFLLMLVGGLGFMVLATFLLMLMGGRSTLEERLLMRDFMRDTVGIDHLREINRVGRRVILIVFVIYILGAAGIFLQLNPLNGINTLQDIWHSLFLSVSSFNNAGLNILPEAGDGSSLTRFAENPIFLIIPTLLIMFGGLGWLVLVDLYKNHKFSRFNLNTKLVIVTSIFLWGFGLFFLLVGESFNPDTLGQLNWTDKIMNAIFGSVSGRTAGFVTIDFADVTTPTKLIFSILMFIGGGAGSVAGGIKVATFGLIVASVISALKGRSEVEAFGRQINPAQFYRAITVALLGLGLIIITTPVLTLTDPNMPFVDLLFDTVSAFGTTGTSTGVAGDLSVSGKCIFMVAMLVGRLGPVALALTISEYGRGTNYRFMRERVEIA